MKKAAKKKATKKVAKKKAAAKKPKKSKKTTPVDFARVMREYLGTKTDLIVRIYVGEFLNPFGHGVEECDWNTITADKNPEPGIAYLRFKFDKVLSSAQPIDDSEADLPSIYDGGN